VHYKRFTTNQFFREKNPTIVTFPTKTALRLSDVVPVPVDGKTGVCEVSSYDLIANICHDGTPDAGTYRAHVFHKSDGNWYDMRDLSVEEVLPQQVAITETYMQIWERRAEDAKPAPKEEEEDIFGLGDLGGDTMEA
jgi:U4/U6.U5 tri-snRNP-associated protein 2